MALDLRSRLAELGLRWSDRGFELGCGTGIARGEATLGRIGFEGRFDYAAIGSVANLAARLCDEARDGEILISEPVAAAVGGLAAVESRGSLALKGFPAAVPAFAVTGSHR
jgi:adenylate cyclase